MKNSKIIPLKTDQPNDQETVHKIAEGLELLDKLKIDIPNQNWFEHMVLEQQKRAKEKWQKELFLFSLIALCIISGIVYSLYRIPIIFILLQFLGIAVIFVYFMHSLMKRVKTHENE
jgi:Flp pilus assembly protein TadB